MSHAFLSQVERGLARPSMTTLGEIAEALGIGTSALLSQPSTGFARIVRRDSAPMVFTRTEESPVDAWALTGENALINVIEIAGSFARSELMAHPGEEAVYVVEGEIEVILGEESYVLGPGDVLNFDSRSSIRTVRSGQSRHGSSSSSSIPAATRARSKKVCTSPARQQVHFAVTDTEASRMRTI